VRLGVVDGRALLIGASGAGASVPDRFGADPMALFERWDELRAWAETVRDYDRAVAGVEAPVPRPRQVFAVALNYPPHAAEAGFTPPEDPLVFTKFPSCLTGPDATVRLPDGKVDWEAELVVVIGKRAHHVSADTAWEYVAGLTIGQDLSERVVQSRGKPAQFSLGKSFPGFGPIGPFLVTPDELTDPDDLEVTALLNGEVVQHDRTKSMIFSVSELVARLAAILPLLPGDLIFTGTPAGVGNRRTPPRYLAAGDELVTRIEGLGEIRQRFAR
jgi:2-keto-4-pentenoate hydratase/2-oxohepta-3-ene-1,7-dioic acid hydratase in catechol pathway